MSFALLRTFDMAAATALVMAVLALQPAYAQNDDNGITSEEILARGDADRGERVFRRCMACHTIAEGAGHRLGPNLWGLFGRTAGTREGYNYSRALQDADLEWTPEVLNEWLQSPRGFLPGNKMSFAGVPRAEDRYSVIAYLEQATSPEE